MLEIRDTRYGKICDISVIPQDHVIVLRALCPQRSLSQARTEEILGSINKMGLSKDAKFIVVGSDIEVTSLDSMTALELTLDGTLPPIINDND